MKRFIFFSLTLLLVAAFIIASRPAAKTGPENPLIGKWQALSRGKKKLPENIQAVWTFDEDNLLVTVNGDVDAKSQYSLRKDEEHDVISFYEDGKKEPIWFGWYELKNDKLRIQATLFTGKPPVQWNEDEVVLFQRAPAK